MENENERTVYFSSKTTLDWDTYKEVQLLKYRKLNPMVLSCLLIIAICCGLLFWLDGLTATICILVFGVAFFLLVLGIKLKKEPIILHGQQRIKLCKDIVEQVTEFSDKIYVSSNADLDRSYDYSLIEKLYETKNYYFLVMPYNVVLAVDKSTLKGSCGVEFRHFIFDKCYSVKEPIFKKVRNGVKMLDRLTVAAFLLAIVVLMLYFFRITPENWRELGRNPQYSSSYQATGDNESE